ncbi:hypothetical protein ELH51_12785 [Rhizobium ruizarguesonis]|nr:hypothetical protein [Rhizobium ruizarguesonis]TBB22528.1 hypothetical protein ELH51_12785 [Rhizobium ruizarguesonis]
MRVDQKQVYFGAFDYWRVFGNSIFVICKSYREDANRLRHKVNYPFLTSVQIFIRLHSLLAHATLIAPNVAGLKRVAFFIDHRGLDKRILGRDFDYGLRVHTHLAAEQDQYRYRIVVDVGELMKDYFSVLKRLSVPLLEIWAGANFEPDQWFTRDKIDGLVQYLQKEGSSVRLLDETAQTADA